jgi:hypothetical protein
MKLERYNVMYSKVFIRAARRARWFKMPMGFLERRPLRTAWMFGFATGNQAQEGVEDLHLPRQMDLSFWIVW